MLFVVDTVKTVEVDKGVDDKTETWITLASDREGNKIVITTKEFFGIHPGDELELKKAAGQATILETFKKPDPK